VPCDVRDPAACTAAVDEAVTVLGGLDALVYATGMSPLRRLADTDAAGWDDVLRTNLVGAALVTAAAVQHLEAAQGSAVYLSSHSVPAPWPGLGAYAASKAGLETLVKAWASEHPMVRFATYVVGPTMTGFADDWDQQLAAELMPQWADAGLLDVAAVREPGVVADEILALV
jgi:NAD(P)-dependent dehydrogenase (short-subunit alcohol dehydrogenase family)